MAMHTPDAAARTRRAGFTLIEMLVVVTIIVVLASLVVAFLPSINDGRKASNGASIVQGALLQAKQRALRDQAPRGIRLIRDSDNPNYASTLQFIEQPENFSQGSVIASPSTPVPDPVILATTGVDTSKPWAVFSNADLFGGFGPSDPTLWPVQPGDYLVIQTTVYRITLVASSGLSPGVGDTVQVVSPFPASAQAALTSDYYIVRGPRPLTADQPVELPQDVAIDLRGVGQTQGGLPQTGLPGTAQTPPRSIILPDAPTDANGNRIKDGNGNPIEHLDILFSPTGPVMRQGTKTGKFVLWVRDITKDDWEGDQILVTVYTRTGLVAPQPADPDTTHPNAPYTYTQDGLSSGE